MTELLSKLKDRLKKIALYEERVIDSDYIEVVYFSKDHSFFEDILSSLFGKPVKDSGQAPNKSVKLLAQAYGGVFENQILYCTENETRPVIAMLWPWQDREHITLKVASLPLA